MQDTITVEVLADGTIKITTDPISAANHTSAEKLLQSIAEFGETKRERRPDAHHHHSHDHHHHAKA